MNQNKMIGIAVVVGLIAAVACFFIMKATKFAEDKKAPIRTIGRIVISGMIGLCFGLMTFLSVGQFSKKRRWSAKNIRSESLITRF